MPFSEKIKLEAKRKSNFKCVICKKEIATEVHHIIPQAAGGDDTIDNAAPMCPTCHDIYGGNPEKRKLIRQMRDHWFEQVERCSRNIKDLEKLYEDPEYKKEDKKAEDRPVAIYHVVYEYETFEEAANTLFELIAHAQKQMPNKNRALYLDIDGHRNENGGFDNDMFELQCEYMLGFLMPYLNEVHMPLGDYINKQPQKNDLPDLLQIL